MNKTTFIALLSQDTQEAISNALRNQGIDGDEIEVALAGRLCDVEDIIDTGMFD